MSIDFSKELPGGFTISEDRNIETLNHLPIAQYSYEYEKTLIECSECGAMIPFDKIQKDWIYSDDDSIEYDKCPACGMADTFDYYFQRIGDALKEKQ